MSQYVYPGLEGANHAQLVYYYSLLQGCGEAERVSPDAHLKLLRKIKAAAPGARPCDTLACVWTCRLQRLAGKNEMCHILCF